MGDSLLMGEGNPETHETYQVFVQGKKMDRTEAGSVND